MANLFPIIFPFNNESPEMKKLGIQTEFNVYTEAVCEENGNIECHDEVFVDCNGVETKLGNIVGNNPEFELDWEDPRE